MSRDDERRRGGERHYGLRRGGEARRAGGRAKEQAERHCEGDGRDEAKSSDDERRRGGERHCGGEAGEQRSGTVGGDESELKGRQMRVKGRQSRR